MNRRTATVVLLIAVLAAVGGFIFYRYRSVVVVVQPTESATEPVPIAPGGPTPLPDSFESAGLVSRRYGSLRIYLAVPREISLTRNDREGSGQTSKTLASIPIAVVIENDTYKKADLAADPSGDDLFTLTVSREGEEGAEVFSHREPRAPESSEWRPAERKTFTVSWPATNINPGVYSISLRPAFGTQETVQIRTAIR